MTATYTQREIEIFMHGMEYSATVAEGVKRGRSSAAVDAIRWEITTTRLLARHNHGFNIADPFRGVSFWTVLGEVIAAALIVFGLPLMCWMGVLPTAHRKGIGRALISELIQDFKSQGITSIYVSTLGDTVEYPPYAETRAFYRAVGFSDFKRLQHPDNPECEEELILKMEAPQS